MKNEEMTTNETVAGIAHTDAELDIAELGDKIAGGSGSRGRAGENTMQEQHITKSGKILPGRMAYRTPRRRAALSADKATAEHV